MAQKIRTMNKYVALSCFVDYISNSNITKLSSFDYVVTNKLPTDLVSEKPEIISMGVDLSIENKTRADIIEEVFFILGDI
jgi:hypothetical protein